MSLQDFETYYKATVIQPVWYCHKEKYINQWNRLKSQEINPHIYIAK